MVKKYLIQTKSRKGKKKGEVKNAVTLLIQTFNHNNQSDIHLINLRDDQYPLFLAIGDGDIKAVRILIENDADHSYTSANGSTLLMHAINLGKGMCLTF